MRYRLEPRLAAVFTFCLFYSLSPAAQQEREAEPVTPSVATGEELVTYPVGFFQRYQPNNALDMLRQVPGFQIDDGGSLRGFGSAAGNILINDRRPTTKEDAPSAILARIPPSHVSRIELIRGELRGIDLRGQSVVANIILREDAPAAGRWEASMRQTFGHGLAPGANVSLSDRWQGIDYNTGIDGRFSNFGDPGPEQFFDGDGNLIEERFNDNGTPGFEGYDLNSFINASSLIGETFVQFNTKLNAEMRDELTVVTREPVTGDPSEEFIEVERRNLRAEMGLDATRNLRENLDGKAILLFNYLHQYPSDAQRNFDNDGNRTLFRVADTTADKLEAISRIELDWSGWENHAVQANFEGAYNLLDNELLQRVDTGGGLTPVEVPGANTKVEEIRGDFILKDTWTLNDFVLDYGLGLEVSTIKTSGDSNQKRTFEFLKPEALITYAPVQEQQTRLRLAREVAQLDLTDFVSATVFLDDDLALGNPNLKPQTTWATELSHERRFGELGVITVSLFHDWITDVEDLLPITDEFEAPGNIGDGRRWGLQLETTLPLEEWIGLAGARLDVDLSWQDSSVTDPVTDEDRVLSSVSGIDPGIAFDNETDYTYIVTYRQDFEDARVAWGWDVSDQDQRTLFKVDELDVWSTDVHLNAFIETTRWWGLKFRLDAVNITNYDEDRDRTLFVGQRNLSSVLRREVDRRNNGTRLLLTVSGTF